MNVSDNIILPMTGNNPITIGLIDNYGQNTGEINMDYRLINGKYVFKNIRGVYFDLTIEEVVEMRKALQDIERIFSPQKLDSLPIAGPDRA